MWQATWAPMLSWWQWLAVAAVPPAIVLLYFLKLKRLPLEVPSTYLWHKSIEDLHVNSIWQKLRQSLLLFLQLLLILLAILALLRPSWNATTQPGDRFVFLIDTSASMASTDVKPSRLEEAKRQALAQIDAMETDDVAMVISFSDSARVEQQFTGSRKLLRKAVEGIRQTNRTTNMKEALQVAGGLANPGRSATDFSDVQVAEAMPAELKIYTDGGLERVEDFALGNLNPEYNQMGLAVYKNNTEADPAKRGPVVEWADNVGITAFSTRRKEGRSLQLEAFGRLENFSPQDLTVDVELRLDGDLIDARAVEVPAGESAGVPFDLGEVESGVLELKAKTGDVLAADDIAWTTVNPPRRAKVLMVTLGIEPLEFALKTERARALAEVRFETPSFLMTPEYEAAALGEYSLIIYDRCQPKQMPRCNTLFVGALPSVKEWQQDEKVNVPQVIDTDRSHPLMQLIELGDVIIAEGTPLKPPKGSTTLIDTTSGPLFAIAPREGYEDAVLGFQFYDDMGNVGTNWPVRLSFPVWVLNVLEYLGGSGDPLAIGSVKPGQPITLQTDTPGDSLTVLTPDKRSVTVKRGNLNAFNFAETDLPGVYEVQQQGKTVQRFAVNLFHPPESDIKPRDITIGHTEIAGQKSTEPARREVWKLLLLLALAVLLFEWYIYNRRVYL